MNRIAIFQYQWPLQAQEVNLIQKLRDAGFEVDFFIYQCRAGELVDIDRFQSDPLVNVYDLTQAPEMNRSIFKRVFLSFLYCSGLRIDQKIIISKRILRRSRKLLRGCSYLIGIEKRGLIWAGEVVKHEKSAKLLYYSLELYLEAAVYKPVIPQFNEQRRLEKIFHSRCAATIIQEPERAKVLFDFNHVKNNLIYLPVSVKGKKILKHGDYFHKKFGLDKDIKIILYFGMLSINRFCDELMEQSKDLRENEMMILHGFGSREDVEKLHALEHPKVKLSLDTIPEDQIGELISSCDVGIALYSNKCHNERLTAFSSEKVALYSQAGKPFVAFDYKSYRKLRNEFICCELIQTTKDVPIAVETILENYDYYQEEAFKAFDFYYDFDKVSESLVQYLQKGN